MPATLPCPQCSYANPVTFYACVRCATPLSPTRATASPAANNTAQQDSVASAGHIATGLPATGSVTVKRPLHDTSYKKDFWHIGGLFVLLLTIIISIKLALNPLPDPPVASGSVPADSSDDTNSSPSELSSPNASPWLRPPGKGLFVGATLYSADKEIMGQIVGVDETYAAAPLTGYGVLIQAGDGTQAWLGLDGLSQHCWMRADDPANQHRNFKNISSEGFIDPD